MLNRFLSEVHKISEISRLCVEAVLLNVPCSEFAGACAAALEDNAFGPLASLSWRNFKASIDACQQANVAPQRRSCTSEALRCFVETAFKNGMSLADTTAAFHTIFTPKGVDHIIEGHYLECERARQELDEALSGRVSAQLESYFGYGANLAGYRPAIIGEPARGLPDADSTPVVQAFDTPMADGSGVSVEAGVEPANALSEPVRKILTLAARPDGVTVRELKRTTAAWNRDPEGLQAALDAMVGSGRLVAASKESEAAGGRPTTVYKLGAN